MWQSLLFKVIKINFKKEEAQKKKITLKQYKQKSDNGNPKRIWL